MKVQASVLNSEMQTLADANVSEVFINASGIYEIIQTVQTNVDGKFLIDVRSENSLLMASYVGYDYDVQSASKINSYGRFELYPKSNVLDEVNVLNPKKKNDDSYLLYFLALLGISLLVYSASKNKVKPLKVKA